MSRYRRLVPDAPSRYVDDLRFAHLLADSVEGLTMERFRAADLRVDAKPDLTPVTEADLAAEQAIRRLVARGRPRDAVLGEEEGLDGTAARRWIVDPIDGTKNYVRGVPVWATLIALLDADEDPDVPVVGVVAAPALGRRWWAAQGTGAWAGRSQSKGTAIRVSQVADLDDASLSFADLRRWSAIGRRDAVVALSEQVWRSRAYGDFWSHVLVAEGAVDIAPEPDLAVHDMAALAPIVIEAGGRFTSLTGRTGVNGGNAVSSNGLLHDEILARLGDVAEAAEGAE